ncbi:MAG: AAC(3) family N-acetyltransferase [Planctomycetota bacterium]
MTDAVDPGWVRRMAEDLARLGVRRGGVLLVHASFKALSPVPGGAETVMAGLLEAITARGTLLMPALSYTTVTPEQPVFEQAQTPSCVGYLSEFFRTRAGTQRSLHPTHSVCAVGPQAGALLNAHRNSKTPVGEHSPFRKLRDMDGQILMLGCGLKPNTSMHGVEELQPPPYLYGPVVVYTVKPGDGMAFEMRLRTHGFQGFAQRYDRIEALLAPAGHLRKGTVAGAESFLIEAPAMWRAGELALRRDPLHFVEKIG